MLEAFLPEARNPVVELVMPNAVSGVPTPFASWITPPSACVNVTAVVPDAVKLGILAVLIAATTVAIVELELIVIVTAVVKVDDPALLT